MQRIIKFRGKRVDNGEWVYGDLYQERKPFHDEITDVFIVEWRKDLCLVSGAPSNNHWWRKVDPETVGQFTGLISKNGKRIYEGDIVNIPLFGNSIIIWNESISAFQYAYHAIGKGTSIGGRMTNTLYSDEQPKYEVIGNIYENSDLLEK